MQQVTPWLFRANVFLIILGFVGVFFTPEVIIAFVASVWFDVWSGFVLVSLAIFGISAVLQKDTAETRSLSFTIPITIEQQLRYVADQEKKSTDDVITEALTYYLSDKVT